MNQSNVRPPAMCSECGKFHNFPVPRFSIGQRVRLVRPVSDCGYHHRDKIGQVTTIVRVCTYMVMPCDKVQYETGWGDGYVLEGRLEAVK